MPLTPALRKQTTCGVLSQPVLHSETLVKTFFKKGGRDRYVDAVGRQEGNPRPDLDIW